MSVGLSESVDMHDFKIKLRHALENPGWRRGTRSHGIDSVSKLFLFRDRRIGEHIENHGCPAKMSNVVFLDKFEELPGIKCSNTDYGGGKRGHGPGMPPAVTVKHRYRVQVTWMRRQGPGDDSAHGHQVGAPVMVDHALGSAGGT